MMNKSYRMRVSSNYKRFEFVSRGPKGAILKILQFKEIAENTFELTLADQLENGTLDFYSVSDNKDLDIILSTIMEAIHSFFKVHTNTYIFFTGTTTARIRLYRIIINSTRTELEKDFKIFGIGYKENKRFIETFVSNTSYESFLISKNKINLQV